MKRFISLILTFALLLPSGVSALSPEQRRVIDSGALYFNVEEYTDVCAVGGVVKGTDNIATIYNYLINKEVQGSPLQDFMVAGILANMFYESGIEPQRLQGTPPGTVTPAENVPRGQSAKAWGLVQWDPAHKMIDPVTQDGKDPGSITAQLDFLLAQLNGETPSPEKAAGIHLISTTNVAEATLSFETKYERHKGPPQPERITKGEEILAQLQSQTSTTSVSNTSSGITVALDPGHGGAVPMHTDPETGLQDRETTNSPEREDVLDVANRVKSQLESAGYKVVMLRNSADQSISKRARVDAAVAAGADLAVSIHTTPGEINEVWPQHQGGYRQKPNGEKVVFDNQVVADKSFEYSNAIAAARTESEGHNVSVKTTTFSGRDYAPGDLTHVQLWSPIPWVYNEIAQNTPNDGIDDQRKQAYADGIANGIKASLVNPGSNNSNCSNFESSGDVVATALNYAWSDWRGSGYVEMKPEYETAMNTARSAGQYVGGRKYIGVDCGGFVTRVMIDSGFDAQYNHSGAVSSGAGYTAIQLEWVRNNWTKIGKVSSTSELQPGDVAFRVTASGENDGHTFMFVGDQPGFEEDIASASLDSRAPMAGRENPLASNIEWYRKK